MITGGAGFIGSHLAERLMHGGRRLVLVDDLSTGSRVNVEMLLGSGCRLIEKSVIVALRDEPGLLDGVREIYHLAATVGVRRAVEEPVHTIENNIDQTLVLLRAAAEREIPLMLTSSSEVYGRNPQIPLREGHDLLLGPTDSPRWSYALSKAVDEHLALGLYAARGLPVVIARLFNTVGPRQSGHYGMVVPRFIRWALAGEDIVIHGDGRQTRCFCDVRDVVAGLVDLLGTPTHYGQVFNIGSDDELTINELADRVIGLTGSTSGKRYVPLNQAYGAPLDDPPRRVPDLTKIRGAIGFAPQYPLERTLQELITEHGLPKPRPRGVLETG